MELTKNTPFSWKFTLPLYLGSTLNPINSSLIATALVPISLSLRVPVGQVAALVAAVYLTSSVAQPAAGKLSEVLGPRLVFLVGTLCVFIAGLVGGFGQNLAQLIVARVLVGLGSSTAYPSAMILVRRRAAEAGLKEIPGGILGGLAVAGMAIAALGLPLGGFLVGTAGWRMTFFANIPIALLTFLFGFWGLPNDKGTRRFKGASKIFTQLDLGGMVLFAGSITSLLSFLLSLPRTNWILLSLVVVTGMAFIFWELKVQTPFIDLRLLFRNGALSRTYARVALTGLIMYGVMYGVSQWLEPARGFSPEQAGFLLLPMTLVAPFVSFPVSKRNLVRGPLLVTSVALVVGSISLLTFNSQTPVFTIVIVMLAFGIVMGLFSVANQTALYSQAPAHDMGTAAGLFRTFAYLGSIGSSALTGIIFSKSVNNHGLSLLAWTFLGASVLVFILTIFDKALHNHKRGSYGKQTDQ